jgi:hypothetical protein
MNVPAEFPLNKVVLLGDDVARARVYRAGQGGIGAYITIFSASFIDDAGHLHPAKDFIIAHSQIPALMTLCQEVLSAYEIARTK